MNELEDYCNLHGYEFNLKVEDGVTFITVYLQTGDCIKYGYNHGQDNLVVNMILKDLEKVCSLK